MHGEHAMEGADSAVLLQLCQGLVAEDDAQETQLRACLQLALTRGMQLPPEVDLLLLARVLGHSLTTQLDQQPEDGGPQIHVQDIADMERLLDNCCTSPARPAELVERLLTLGHEALLACGTEVCLRHLRCASEEEPVDWAAFRSSVDLVLPYDQPLLVAAAADAASDHDGGGSSALAQARAAAKAAALPAARERRAELLACIPEPAQQLPLAADPAVSPPQAAPDQLHLAATAAAAHAESVLEAYSAGAAVVLALGWLAELRQHDLGVDVLTLMTRLEEAVAHEQASSVVPHRQGGPATASPLASPALHGPSSLHTPQSRPGQVLSPERDPARGGSRGAARRSGSGAAAGAATAAAPRVRGDSGGGGGFMQQLGSVASSAASLGLGMFRWGSASRHSSGSAGPASPPAAAARANSRDHVGGGSAGRANSVGRAVSVGRGASAGLPPGRAPSPARAASTGRARGGAPGHHAAAAAVHGPAAAARPNHAAGSPAVVSKQLFSKTPVHQQQQQQQLQRRTSSAGAPPSLALAAPGQLALGSSRELLHSRRPLGQGAPVAATAAQQLPAGGVLALLRDGPFGAGKAATPSGVAAGRPGSTAAHGGGTGRPGAGGGMAAGGTAGAAVWQSQGPGRGSSREAAGMQQQQQQLEAAEPLQAAMRATRVVAAVPEQQLLLPGKGAAEAAPAPAPAPAVVSCAHLPTPSHPAAPHPLSLASGPAPEVSTQPASTAPWTHDAPTIDDEVPTTPTTPTTPTATTAESPASASPVPAMRRLDMESSAAMAMPDMQSDPGLATGSTTPTTPTAAAPSATMSTPATGASSPNTSVASSNGEADAAEMEEVLQDWGGEVAAAAVVQEQAALAAAVMGVAVQDAQGALGAAVEPAAAAAAASAASEPAAATVFQPTEPPPALSAAAAPQAAVVAADESTGLGLGPAKGCAASPAPAAFSTPLSDLPPSPHSIPADGDAKNRSSVLPALGAAPGSGSDAGASLAADAEAAAAEGQATCEDAAAAAITSAEQHVDASHLGAPAVGSSFQVGLAEMEAFATEAKVAPPAVAVGREELALAAAVMGVAVQDAQGALGAVTTGVSVAAAATAVSMAEQPGAAATKAAFEAPACATGEVAETGLGPPMGSVAAGVEVALPPQSTGVLSRPHQLPADQEDEVPGSVPPQSLPVTGATAGDAAASTAAGAEAEAAAADPDSGEGAVAAAATAAPEHYLLATRDDQALSSVAPAPLPTASAALSGGASAVVPSAVAEALAVGQAGGEDVAAAAAGMPATVAADSAPTDEGGEGLGSVPLGPQSATSAAPANGTGAAAAAVSANAAAVASQIGGGDTVTSAAQAAMAAVVAERSDNRLHSHFSPSLPASPSSRAEGAVRSPRSPSPPPSPSTSAAPPGLLLLPAAKPSTFATTALHSRCAASIADPSMERTLSPAEPPSSPPTGPSSAPRSLPPPAAKANAAALPSSAACDSLGSHDQPQGAIDALAAAPSSHPQPDKDAAVHRADEPHTQAPAHPAAVSPPAAAVAPSCACAASAAASNSLLRAADATEALAPSCSPSTRALVTLAPQPLQPLSAAAAASGLQAPASAHAPDVEAAAAEPEAVSLARSSLGLEPGLSASSSPLPDQGHGSQQPGQEASGHAPSAPRTSNPTRESAPKARGQAAEELETAAAAGAQEQEAEQAAIAAGPGLAATEAKTLVAAEIQGSAAGEAEQQVAAAEAHGQESEQAADAEAQMPTAGAAETQPAVAEAQGLAVRAPGHQMAVAGAHAQDQEQAAAEAQGLAAGGAESLASLKVQGQEAEQVPVAEAQSPAAGEQKEQVACVGAQGLAAGEVEQAALAETQEKAAGEVQQRAAAEAPELAAEGEVGQAAASQARGQAAAAAVQVPAARTGAETAAAAGAQVQAAGGAETVLVAEAQAQEAKQLADAEAEELAAAQTERVVAAVAEAQQHAAREAEQVGPTGAAAAAPQGQEAWEAERHAAAEAQHQAAGEAEQVVPRGAAAATSQLLAHATDAAAEAEAATAPEPGVLPPDTAAFAQPSTSERPWEQLLSSSRLLSLPSRASHSPTDTSPRGSVDGAAAPVFQPTEVGPLLQPPPPPTPVGALLCAAADTERAAAVATTPQTAGDTVPPSSPPSSPPPSPCFLGFAPYALTSQPMAASDPFHVSSPTPRLPSTSPRLSEDVFAAATSDEPPAESASPPGASTPCPASALMSPMHSPSLGHLAVSPTASSRPLGVASPGSVDLDLHPPTARALPPIHARKPFPQPRWPPMEPDLPHISCALPATSSAPRLLLTQGIHSPTASDSFTPRSAASPSPFLGPGQADSALPPSGDDAHHLLPHSSPPDSPTGRDSKAPPPQLDLLQDLPLMLLASAASALSPPDPPSSVAALAVGQAPVQSLGFAKEREGERSGRPRVIPGLGPSGAPSWSRAGGTEVAAVVHTVVPPLGSEQYMQDLLGDMEFPQYDLSEGGSGAGSGVNGVEHEEGEEEFVVESKRLAWEEVQEADEPRCPEPRGLRDGAEGEQEERAGPVGVEEGTGEAPAVAAAMQVFPDAEVPREQQEGNKAGGRETGTNEEEEEAESKVEEEMESEEEETESEAGEEEEEGEEEGEVERPEEDGGQEQGGGEEAAVTEPAGSDHPLLPEGKEGVDQGAGRGDTAEQAQAASQQQWPQDDVQLTCGGGAFASEPTAADVPCASPPPATSASQHAAPAAPVATAASEPHTLTPAPAAPSLPATSLTATTPATDPSTLPQTLLSHPNNNLSPATLTITSTPQPAPLLAAATSSAAAADKALGPSVPPAPHSISSSATPSPSPSPPASPAATAAVSVLKELCKILHIQEAPGMGAALEVQPLPALEHVPPASDQKLPPSSVVPACDSEGSGKVGAMPLADAEDEPARQVPPPFTHKGVEKQGGDEYAQEVEGAEGKEEAGEERQGEQEASALEQGASGRLEVGEGNAALVTSAADNGPVTATPAMAEASVGTAQRVHPAPEKPAAAGGEAPEEPAAAGGAAGPPHQQQQQEPPASWQRPRTSCQPPASSQLPPADEELSAALDSVDSLLSQVAPHEEEEAAGKLPVWGLRCHAAVQQAAGAPEKEGADGAATARQGQGEAVAPQGVAGGSQQALLPEGGSYGLETGVGEVAAMVAAAASDVALAHASNADAAAAEAPAMAAAAEHPVTGDGDDKASSSSMPAPLPTAAITAPSDGFASMDVAAARAVEAAATDKVSDERAAAATAAVAAAAVATLQAGGPPHAPASTSSPALPAGQRPPEEVQLQAVTEGLQPAAGSEEGLGGGSVQAVVGDMQGRDVELEQPTVCASVSSHEGEVQGSPVGAAAAATSAGGGEEQQEAGQERCASVLDPSSTDAAPSGAKEAEVPQPLSQGGDDCARAAAAAVPTAAVPAAPSLPSPPPTSAPAAPPAAPSPILLQQPAGPLSSASPSGAGPRSRGTGNWRKGTRLRSQAHRSATTSVPRRRLLVLPYATDWQDGRTAPAQHTLADAAAKGMAPVVPATATGQGQGLALQGEEERLRELVEGARGGDGERAASAEGNRSSKGPEAAVQRPRDVAAAQGQAEGTARAAPAAAAAATARGSKGMAQAPPAAAPATELAAQPPPPLPLSPPLSRTSGPASAPKQAAPSPPAAVATAPAVAPVQRQQQKQPRSSPPPRPRAAAARPARTAEGSTAGSTSSSGHRVTVSEVRQALRPRGAAKQGRQPGAVGRSPTPGPKAANSDAAAVGSHPATGVSGAKRRSPDNASMLGRSGTEPLAKRQRPAGRAQQRPEAEDPAGSGAAGSRRQRQLSSRRRGVAAELFEPPPLPPRAKGGLAARATKLAESLGKAGGSAGGTGGISAQPRRTGTGGGGTGAGRVEGGVSSGGGEGGLAARAAKWAAKRAAGTCAVGHEDGSACDRGPFVVASAPVPSPGGGASEACIVASAPVPPPSGVAREAFIKASAALNLQGVTGEACIVASAPLTRGLGSSSATAVLPSNDGTEGVPLWRSLPLEELAARGLGVRRYSDRDPVSILDKGCHVMTAGQALQLALQGVPLRLPQHPLPAARNANERLYKMLDKLKNWLVAKKRLHPHQLQQQQQQQVLPPQQGSRQVGHRQQQRQGEQEREEEELQGEQEEEQPQPAAEHFGSCIGPEAPTVQVARPADPLRPAAAQAAALPPVLGSGLGPRGARGAAQVAATPGSAGVPDLSLPLPVRSMPTRPPSSRSKRQAAVKPGQEDGSSGSSADKARVRKVMRAATAWLTKHMHDPLLEEAEEAGGARKRAGAAPAAGAVAGRQQPPQHVQQEQRELWRQQAQEREEETARRRESTELLAASTRAFLSEINQLQDSIAASLGKLGVQAREQPAAGLSEGELQGSGGSSAAAGGWASVPALGEQGLGVQQQQQQQQARQQLEGLRRKQQARHYAQLHAAAAAAQQQQPVCGGLKAPQHRGSGGAAGSGDSYDQFLVFLKQQQQQHVASAAAAPSLPTAGAALKPAAPAGAGGDEPQGSGSFSFGTRVPRPTRDRQEDGHGDGGSRGERQEQGSRGEQGGRRSKQALQEQQQQQLRQQQRREDQACGRKSKGEGQEKAGAVLAKRSRRAAEAVGAAGASGARPHAGAHALATPEQRQQQTRRSPAPIGQAAGDKGRGSGAAEAAAEPGAAHEAPAQGPGAGAGPRSSRAPWWERGSTTTSAGSGDDGGRGGDNDSADFAGSSSGEDSGGHSEGGDLPGMGCGGAGNNRGDSWSGIPWRPQPAAAAGEAAAAVGGAALPGMFPFGLSPMQQQMWLQQQAWLQQQQQWMLLQQQGQQAEHQAWGMHHFGYGLLPPVHPMWQAGRLAGTGRRRRWGEKRHGGREEGGRRQRGKGLGVQGVHGARGTGEQQQREPGVGGEGMDLELDLGLRQPANQALHFVGISVGAAAGLGSGVPRGVAAPAVGGAVGDGTQAVAGEAAATGPGEQAVAEGPPASKRQRQDGGQQQPQQAQQQALAADGAARCPQPVPAPHASPSPTTPSPRPVVAAASPATAGPDAKPAKPAWTPRLGPGGAPAPRPAASDEEMSSLLARYRTSTGGSVRMQAARSPLGAAATRAQPPVADVLYSRTVHMAVQGDGSSTPVVSEVVSSGWEGASLGAREAQGGAGAHADALAREDEAMLQGQEGGGGEGGGTQGDSTVGLVAGEVQQQQQAAAATAVAAAAFQQQERRVVSLNVLTPLAVPPPVLGSATKPRRAAVAQQQQPQPQPAGRQSGVGGGAGGGVPAVRKRAADVLPGLRASEPAAAKPGTVRPQVAQSPAAASAGPAGGGGSSMPGRCLPFRSAPAAHGDESAFAFASGSQKHAEEKGGRQQQQQPRQLPLPKLPSLAAADPFAFPAAFPEEEEGRGERQQHHHHHQQPLGGLVFRPLASMEVQGGGGQHKGGDGVSQAAGKKPKQGGGGVAAVQKPALPPSVLQHGTGAGGTGRPHDRKQRVGQGMAHGGGPTAAAGQGQAAANGRGATRQAIPDAVVQQEQEEVQGRKREAEPTGGGRETEDGSMCGVASLFEGLG